MLPRSEKVRHADEARARHWRTDRDGPLYWCATGDSSVCL